MSLINDTFLTAIQVKQILGFCENKSNRHRCMKSGGNNVRFRSKNEIIFIISLLISISFVKYIFFLRKEEQSKILSYI